MRGKCLLAAVALLAPVMAAAETFTITPAPSGAPSAEVLPVTRKHLLPILRHFDSVGITTRKSERRAVSNTLPDGWE